MQKNIIYYPDCKHFRADLPCKPHKKYDVHCENCEYYDKKTKKILIIKLGAIGDVIRTTPLVEKIRKEMPEAAIWWLTYSPDILPNDAIEKIFPFTPESLLVLKATKFDTVMNLDKDQHACALMTMIDADNRIGYTLKDGMPAPVNDNAVHKFHTGLFDDVNQANTLSYPQEIFNICGWEFEGEEYLLDSDKSIDWKIPREGKKIVGLNTGCGDRWTTRLLKEEYWEQLIAMLQKKGYFPMLLGGQQEDEKNLRLAKNTGAYYPGHFSLKEFISLMDECEAVVTAVTMGFHIAVGLKKKVILMNNIFNKYEFELYGRGEIVEPDKKCTCFFSPKCTNDEYFCMNSMTPEKIFAAVERSFE